MSCVPYYLYQPSYCYEPYYCEPRCNSRCGPGGPQGLPGTNSNAFLGAIAGTPSTGTPYVPSSTTISLGIGTQQQITSFTTSFPCPITDYVINQSAGTITVLNNGYYDITLSANIQSTTIPITGLFIATASDGSAVAVSSFPNSSSGVMTGENYNAEAIVYLSAGTTLYTFFAYPTTTSTGTATVQGNWASVLVRKVT